MYSPNSPSTRGFSLVELMVSMSILSAMLLMFVGILDQTQNAWQSAQGRVSQFREARLAFDIITKNMSQATLNPYYQALDNDNDSIPDEYAIQSELHFKTMHADDLPNVDSATPGPGHAIFFQAPLGVSFNAQLNTMTNLLNGRGYFVHFGSDREFRPSFVSRQSEKHRYRLMEMVVPSEYNSVYMDHAENLPDRDAEYDEEHEYFTDWWERDVSYKDEGGDRVSGNMLEVFSRPLAENILALVISPRVPLTDLERGQRTEEDAALKVAPDYEYDSQDPEDPDMRHQLPPLIKVTMIAIDEVTAQRLALEHGKTSEYASDLGIRSSWMKRSRDYLDDLDNFVDQVESESDSGVRIQYKISVLQ